MNSIVVHYQELALKGKNRPWFLGRLVRHLRHAVSDLDVAAVRALMGRIEIVLGPTAPLEAVSERIRSTLASPTSRWPGDRHSISTRWRRRFCATLASTRATASASRRGVRTSAFR